MTNAAKIAEWRTANPGKHLTRSVLLEILDKPSLRYANLRNADLGSADLRNANLGGADLRNADLWNADLWNANLGGAYLGGANLSYANWQGLQVSGLPSGQITLTPTPDGWVLRVGCWLGTPEVLAELIAQDDGWPEAVGDEIERRRPGLQVVLDLIEAHTALYPALIKELKELWGAK